MKDSPRSPGQRRPPGVEDGLRSPWTISDLIKEILDDPVPQLRIRRMPGVWLHRLLCEVGRADVGELLEMARPEQVREVLDLQLWEGDRLKAEESLDWLWLLATLPDPVAARHLRALDLELLGWVLLCHVRINLVEEPWTIPDHVGENVYQSPDGWFVLELLPSSRTRREQVIKLVELLYRDDPDEARRLLQRLTMELPSELQETCFRWRNGRLEDMGFSDPQEALVLYAYLPPSSVTIEERTADQPLRAETEPLGALTLAELAPPEASWLGRALARIDDPAERSRLAQALFTLGNMGLAADRVLVSDPEAARESLLGLHARLCLGLLHLSRGNEDLAVQALQGVALLRIARVGHSLVLDLRRPLLPLLLKGDLGRRPWATDLLDPPLDRQIAALALPRPTCWDLSGLSQDLRPFSSLADLQMAQQWVRQALATSRLARRLELVPSPLPELVTLGDLFRTRVAGLLVGHTGPLDRPAVVRFLEQQMRGGRLSSQARERALELALPDGPEERSVVESWMEGLQEALGPLADAGTDPDLRFVGGLWLEGTRSRGYNIRK